MTVLQKFFALGAVMVATAAVAHADSITGSLAVGGTDTYTTTAINFSPSTGYVLGGTGDLAVFTIPNPVNLGSFTYASASGVTLFNTTEAGETLDFIISSVTSATPGSTSSGPDIAIAGTGYFTLTGYTATAGTFNLTSNADGDITSFSLTSTVAATPEPNSLMLLGTGLVSAAGMLFRRRSINA